MKQRWSAAVSHVAPEGGKVLCGNRNCGLRTYPTARPAACRYPPTPPAPPPCHTCSQPEPPERYPTNMFWSGSTCTETTSKAAKNGHFEEVKLFSPFFFFIFLVSFLLAEGEHEGWESGRRGRVMNAYITASCHIWITPGRAGKAGRLLLLAQIGTRSIRLNAVILPLLCNFPFLAALNYG